MSDQAYEQRIASAINEIKSKIRNSQSLSLDLGGILDDQNLRADVVSDMKVEAFLERRKNGPNPTDLASSLWKLFLNLPAPDPPKKSLYVDCVPTSLPKGSISAAIYKYYEEFSVDWQPLPDDYFDNLIETFSLHCNQNLSTSIFHQGSVREVDELYSDLTSSTGKDIWMHCDKKEASIVLQLWHLTLLKVVKILNSLGDTVYCRGQRTIMGQENLSLRPDICVFPNERDADENGPASIIIEGKRLGLRKLIEDNALANSSLVRQVVVNMLNGANDFYILTDYFVHIIFMLADPDQDALKKGKEPNSAKRKELQEMNDRIAEIEALLNETNGHKFKVFNSRRRYLEKEKEGLEKKAGALKQQLMEVPIPIFYKIVENSNKKINLILGSLIHHCVNYTADQKNSARDKSEKYKSIFMKKNGSAQNVKNRNSRFPFGVTIRSIGSAGEAISGNTRGHYASDIKELQDGSSHLSFVASINTAACQKIFPQLPKMKTRSEKIIIKVYDADFLSQYARTREIRKLGFSYEDILSIAAEQYTNEVCSYRQIEAYNNNCKSQANTIFSPKIVFCGTRVSLFDKASIKFGGPAIFMTEIPGGGKITEKSMEFGINQLKLLSGLGINHGDIKRENFIVTPDERVAWIDYGMVNESSTLEGNIQKFVEICNEYI
ncbi:hypothetical protein DASC09_029990 [Saccharomycopsis crataegensis]|uniref:t-SNARE coiled-coil homology domain-containing protein n=1 Tax=Saccharomycopsis crataegensis TaxID=43959 RepID=A0AAV5QM14_9ASCO|nr:hypothetical protein DASC09_029990 [Saccharomycopsis crataegensis]